MSADGFASVSLHADAPPKPPLGQPCNGCGVCCALTPCPVARVAYLRWRGSCPGLVWRPGERRYVCGPLSRRVEAADGRSTLVVRWLRRAIAAGRGCDFAAEVIDQ